MKAVISTAGRFHLFALARELERHGCLERIYSGFLWSALAREDVSRDRVTTFPWLRTPYMALGRLPITLPRALGRWLESMSCITQDAYVAGRLPECDVFVGHDGAGLNAGREAQRRGKAYVADTGTSHVRYRRRMLEEEFALHGLAYSDFNETTCRRQLDEYAAADAIVVPSSFVKKSFVEEGVPAEKIFQIPYGVRTTHFHRIALPSDDRFRVLFVGHFCIRKGARHLLEAFRDFSHPHKELMIAGSIEDEVRPLIASFAGLKVNVLGSIANMELRRTYSACDALVLASVEEGFGMVIAEALACGCPVIASTHTGAPDLYTHGREGFIVPIRDSRAICDCLTRLADEPELRATMSAAAIELMRKSRDWKNYGDAYVGFLNSLIAPMETVSGGGAG